MNKDKVQETLALLGMKVKDKVTGFEGVVTSVGFDLFGCIQAIVTPLAKDGDVKDSRWHDTSRLEVTHNIPVMKPPSFAQDTNTPGGFDKPLMGN